MKKKEYIAPATRTVDVSVEAYMVSASQGMIMLNVSPYDEYDDDELEDL